MRTTVIPAQITTIEDKIAGNLNLIQILILMVPVFWTTIIYTIFTPAMHLAWYKIPLVLSVLFICLLLSLRIKGKVVVSWLGILFRYNIRPKYYVFNKNSFYLRNLDLPIFEKREVKLLHKNVAKKETKQLNLKFSIADFVKFENMIGNPKYTLSYREGKKGGINVAFRQVQK
ncbi:MAG: hypothetical protein M1120_00295 [Patescibacteria group bacterium]|nr:hypothetical protein [Patescibacteria group bacterium]